VHSAKRCCPAPSPRACERPCDRFVIGRAPTAHFQLTQDGAFSRHHLMVETSYPEVRVRDLKSMNGSFVNRQRITGPTVLRHGDVITVLENEVVPLARRKPSVPGAVAAVVERAMHKDPRQRFRTATDMQQALLAATGIRLG
jgi:pSer/pThr/pTyr-binding forkhead associated (FHA) protein